MATGPLSLLYGDLDLSPRRMNDVGLVAFVLAGPLRLKLPNGSDVTIHDGWYIWLPADVFSSVMGVALVNAQNKLAWVPNQADELMEQRRELAEAGYQLPPDDDEEEVPF